MPKIPDFLHLRRDAEESRLKLLAAARRLMAEQGPDAICVSDVAREAGVNRTTAYQHFKSRDALVAAVLDDAANAASGIFAVDMPLEARVDYMVDYFVQHPEFARLWMYQFLSRLPHSHQACRERFIRVMDVFARSPGAADRIDAEMFGDIVAAAILVWSLRVSGNDVDVIGGQVATKRFMREMKRLLLHGAVKSKSSNVTSTLKAKPLSTPRRARIRRASVVI